MGISHAHRVRTWRCVTKYEERQPALSASADSRLSSRCSTPFQTLTRYRSANTRNSKQRPSSLHFVELHVANPCQKTCGYPDASEKSLGRFDSDPRPPRLDTTAVAKSGSLSSGCAIENNTVKVRWSNHPKRATQFWIRRNRYVDGLAEHKRKSTVEKTHRRRLNSYTPGSVTVRRKRRKPTL
eukprot:360597-Amorphochlora_amoeboformis.AAC.1